VSITLDILEKEAFLIVIVSIMIAVNILKHNNVLDPVYYFLQSHIRNKKILLCILSTMYGILPIPGRIMVAVSMLDTCTDGSKDRSGLGIVAYLSTHHYYLWSPLEKSVLIVLASTGMTYIQFINSMSAYICITLILTYGYILFAVKSIDNIVVTFQKPEVGDSRKAMISILLLGVTILLCCIDKSAILYIFPIYTLYLYIKYNPKNILQKIDWLLVFWIGVIIAISTILHTYTDQIKIYAENLATMYGIHVALIVSFFAAVLLGSSSRFAAVTVIMTSIFGLIYMPLFYIVDYCGYLLSPSHKCVSIGNMYFKTKLIIFYKTIGLLSLVLMSTAIVHYFIL